MFRTFLNTFWPWNNGTQETTTTSLIAGPEEILPNESTVIVAQEIADAILKAVLKNTNRKSTPRKYAVVVFESQSWLTIRQKLESLDRNKIDQIKYQQKTIDAWLTNIKLIEDNYNTLQKCIAELNQPNFTTGSASTLRFEKDQENRLKAHEAKLALGSLKTSLQKTIVQNSSAIRTLAKSSNSINLHPEFTEVILTIYSQWSKLWAFHSHEGVTLSSQRLHGKVFEITENAQYQELPLYLQSCGNDVYAVKATYGLTEKNLYLIQSPYEQNTSVGKVESFIEAFAPTSPFIGKGSKINYTYTTPSEFCPRPINDRNGVTNQAEKIQNIIAEAITRVNIKLSDGLKRFNAIQLVK